MSDEPTVDFDGLPLAVRELLVGLDEEVVRYRAAFQSIIDKIAAKASIRHVRCSWCNEAWPELDDDTTEVAMAYARRHAFECAKHPLKIERDQLRNLVDAATGLAAEGFSRGWDALDRRDKLGELARIRDAAGLR